ncbi:hypothetical protein GCM10009844_19460 [Nocardioides koreensis]|uniref:Uncharacterized protein n=1 Tax=Nocardioides koreensis TaxID=433651 RepID=A0ABN2ZNV3_9ACTN
MADRTTELHVAQTENTKLVAARVLSAFAFAFALLAASAAEVLLMMGSWIYSAMWADTPDFPGSYWFAVVPMVVCALVLQARARGLTRD